MTRGNLEGLAMPWAIVVMVVFWPSSIFAQSNTGNNDLSLDLYGCLVLSGSEASTAANFTNCCERCCSHEFASEGCTAFGYSHQLDACFTNANTAKKKTIHTDLTFWQCADIPPCPKTTYQGVTSSTRDPALSYMDGIPERVQANENITLSWTQPYEDCTYPPNTDLEWQFKCGKDQRVRIDIELFGSDGSDGFIVYRLLRSDGTWDNVDTVTDVGRHSFRSNPGTRFLRARFSSNQNMQFDPFRAFVACV